MSKLYQFCTSLSYQSNVSPYWMFSLCSWLIHIAKGRQEQSQSCDRVSLARDMLGIACEGQKPILMSLSTSQVNIVSCKIFYMLIWICKEGAVCRYIRLRLNWEAPQCSQGPVCRSLFTQHPYPAPGRSPSVVWVYHIYTLYSFLRIKFSLVLIYVKQHF